jgi:HEAT repeat-containing protein 5
LQSVFKLYIAHPHITVQAAAAWGLRSFTLAVPSQIAVFFASCKADLQAHLDTLNDPNLQSGRIVLGLAQALAAVIQVSSTCPLYFEPDMVAQTWTLANSLLHLSGKSDIRVSQIQIQVAWGLIGALMSIGGQFIKSRLNQLLMLWQNALPRSLPKDDMATRNLTELQYLLHVRERALAALSLFFHYNSKLLSNDISRRVISMLSDTNVFIGRLQFPSTNDDPRVGLSYHTLAEIATRVMRRVFRCYSTLMQCDPRNTPGPELLVSAISYFADAEPPMSRFVAGKQVIVGPFESLSQAADNYSWGVTSYARFLSIPDENGTVKEEQKSHWSVWDSHSEILERMVPPKPYPC